MNVKQFLSSRCVATSRSGQCLLVALFVFLWPQASIAFDPLNGDFSRANPLDIRIVAYNHNRSFISVSSKDAAFNRILTTLDPDIISFEEFPSSISQADVANRLNAIIPIGGNGWQIHFGLLGGIRTVIASRFPLTMKRTDTIPASSTRGVTLALADLPNATYPVDVYLLAVHLKCCGSAGGSEDQKRQASADAMANWMGDARGVARPSGDNIALPLNTPMIALGDFNLVGGPQPESTILTGNIQDTGTYGPAVQGDWDVSNLTNLMPADPFTGNTFTWQGSSSFPPSALDRFFITDSVITVANSFVLNTDTMTTAALNASGLQAGDTLPSNTSDHLPIVMDLQIVASITDCNGNGVDDAQDIAAGTSPDCNSNGIPDECEVPPIGTGADCNGNGIPDGCETDTDGDGLIDACDTDDDNDGITDANDADPLNPNICQDIDADGCDDCSIGVDGFGPLPDADPANDGTDTDGDGICDAGDNCISIANPGQEDCQPNGIGDVCDIASGTSQDCNSNGIPDECEVPPIGTGADCNGNGVPDQCDPESSDVALFVSQLLAGNPNTVMLCFFDKNGDGQLDGADVQLFEESVINGL